MLAVAALIMLSVSACSGASRGDKGDSVFRLGSVQAIDSLNPFVAIESTAFSVFEYIYPNLVQYDPADHIVSDFARSWEVSPNGKTWTFHTQPNAVWSDGKPLTAADAAWSLNTIAKFQSGPTSSVAAYVSHLTSATAPDPTTLVLQYAEPVANVLSQMTSVQILPEHLWATYATGDGKALTTFDNAAPVVSGGPFKLISAVPNQKALLQRNPTFYGPKPHISGLGLQFFGTDDAMITALKSGQLDGVSTVAPTSVATLKSNGFVVRSAPGLGFDDFIINSNPQQNAAHRELVNPLVREAFDYAMDRPNIVKTSLLGFGQPGSSIIPPGSGHWYDDQIKPTPFDLARANQLLDQAGYPMGSDHVRVANGHKMSYTVIMSADATNGYGSRSFQIIQSEFAKIGVQLHPQHLDNSAATAAIVADQYKSYEIAMWGWGLGEDPDDMLSYLTCGDWGSLNDTGFCGKDWDKLYQDQGTAVNPAERQKIVNQMQQIAAQKRLYLVLDYPNLIEAHSKQWTDLPLVQGTSFDLGSKISFESVRRVG